MLPLDWPASACEPISSSVIGGTMYSKSLFTRAARTEFKRLAFMFLEIFNDHWDKCAVYWTQLPNICGVMYYL